MLQACNLKHRKYSVAYYSLEKKYMLYFWFKETSFETKTKTINDDPYFDT